ncbi:hypothetical protein QR680_010089 [Steinernema hermaphroditum]|uniref:Uncharacterized protein n=1 Tax=Steinernema hermaphroditum TaxID=289476 RepID=A0AA39IPL4_9BILA|nr:hypothetical protein QR680_010089 [Steinernema hermaphroditum]
MVSYGLVVSEFICLTLLWMAAILTCILIFRREPLKVFFTRSPTLFIIFGIICVLAVIYFLFLVLWLLYISEAIGSLAFVGNVAIILGIATSCVETAYDIFTVVLFIQRLAILLAPTRSRKRLDQLLYTLATFLAIVPFVYFGYLYRGIIDFTVRPTAGECRTVGCSEPLKQDRSALDICFVVSTANVVTGAAFVALLLRRKSVPGLQAKKINQITRYLFFFRLTLVVIPLIFDIFFSMQTNVTISYYIGPFGMMGASLEESLFVFVYFVVFRPQTKIVNVSSSRQTS